jgi:hypothetical protein
MPLPTDSAWWGKFNKVVGDPADKAQASLATDMQLNYRAGVGKLIWAMTTCQPDLAFASVKLSQSNLCPHKIHYHGLKHALKFLYNSKDDESTSGGHHHAWNCQKVRFPLSTVINKICFWTIDQNMMLQLQLHMPTLTGLLALKLAVLFGGTCL